MITFAKIRAASSSKAVRAYFVENNAGTEAGQRLSGYYVGSGGRGAWRADMPRAVAQALGVNPSLKPRDQELEHLFEARRAQDGAVWSEHQRKLSAYDFCFGLPKSATLAIEFAETPAEKQMLLAAAERANHRMMRFIAADLCWARRGKGGEEGADPAQGGWWTVRHDQSRPTLQVRDGADGITYLAELAAPGDPHTHFHNPFWNLCVTAAGRVGSLDTQRLTSTRVKLYGAYAQAVLAEELRSLGAEVVVDSSGRFMTLSAIPEDAVALFSKADRQTKRHAKKAAQRKGLDWDTLPVQDKFDLLHEAAKGERLSKAARTGLKAEGLTPHEVWRLQAEAIGWRHRTVLAGVGTGPALTEVQRLEKAYAFAAKHIADEFRTKAVLDHDWLAIWAARGLIEPGIKGPGDVHRVVRMLEERGISFHGKPAQLYAAVVDGRVRVANSEQVALERRVAALSSAAAADKRRALPAEAFRAALARSARDWNADAHSRAQAAAGYALATGGAVTYLTGVAGSGKSTLLQPLVDAYREDGRQVFGCATGWLQADAMKAAGIEKTWAVDPLLKAIASGEFKPDTNTVLIVEEVSQVGPTEFLKLLELQQQTGFQMKCIGDAEQCQAQPLDAKVLTPFGFREMGSLSVGDLVLTPDGKPVPITAVSPRRTKDVYRVTFCDGRAAECCDDHLWKVWKGRPVYSPGSHATRKVINRGGNWAVLPLSEIRKWSDRNKDLARRADVPLIALSAADLPERDLPIPPYALGLLLGDGHFAVATHYCTADQALLDGLMADLPDYDAVPTGRYDYRLRMREVKRHRRGRTRFSPMQTIAHCARVGQRREVLLTCAGRSQTLVGWSREIGIKRQNIYARVAKLGWTPEQALGFQSPPTIGKRTFAPLATKLTALGLSGTRSHDKFVPDLYKCGSADQRLAVLQGLLDTDGTVGEGGTYAIYYTTSERLAKDVQELAWSLGAIANISTRQPKGSPRYRLQYYVGIRHADIRPFFRLPRKRDAAKATIQRVSLKIKSVELVGQKETQCIVVDDPERLYVTDGYVVTHNSISAGSTVEILARTLPSADRPEIRSTVRQKTRRLQRIAGLFRDGEAGIALDLKRQDGTARMLGGDQEQVVDGIADFLIARRDVLLAAGFKKGVGCSALTNADAAAISRAVREKLKVRGEIAKDEAIYRAQDQRGEQYDLPLAAGDRVRLYRKTWGVIDGERGWIGSNGDVVTVQAVLPDVLAVRDRDGRLCTVQWHRLRAPGTDRLLLGPGWCQTVDAIQGATLDEHINALPRGTAGLSKYTGYVAESRAEWVTWTLIGEAGVFETVRQGRAIGDETPITSADLWERVAKDFSYAEPRRLGLDVVEAARQGAGEALARLLEIERAIETGRAAGHDFGDEHQERLRAEALRRFNLATSIPNDRIEPAEMAATASLTAH